MYKFYDIKIKNNIYFVLNNTNIFKILDLIIIISMKN
jgi:hypothetical protein